jgi:hypothetical protein
MVWVQFLWFLVTTVLSVALAPKPKGPTAAAIDDFQFPTAEEGRPIPVVFGTVDITGPNVLWFGALSVKAIRKRSGFSKVTVGYKYSLGFHLGLCHGPVDAVTQIDWAEKTAWTGNITSNGSASISANDLFGGEKREGGVSGTFDIMMGGSAQTANSYLTTAVGGVQPAYRGVLGLVWRGGYVGNTPYVKPLSVRVRRVLQGWYGTAWNTSTALIDGGMNGVHVLYETLTNPQWGMGISPALIDDTSFEAAADIAYAEGLGLNMMWSQAGTVEDFMQIVLNHIAGTLNLRNDTGKYELKLIRGGYDASLLDVYDESNVISLDDYQRVGWGETVNEVTLVYTDPDTKKQTSIVQQDLANIDAQGQRISSVVELKGLQNHALAQVVLARELATRSTPLSSIKLTVNRQAWLIPYGGLFKFSWSSDGRSIEEVVYRVTRIAKGTLQANAIKIEAVEDIYALGVSSYLTTVPSPGTPPGVDTPFDPADEDISVVSTSVTAPPAASPTPANGATYFIPAGTSPVPSGAWAGQGGRIAEWDAVTGTWEFSDVPNQTIVYDSSTEEFRMIVDGIAEQAPWTPSIPPLTEDTAPNFAEDYVVVFDTSAQAYRKVLGQNFAGNPDTKNPALVNSVTGGIWFGIEPVSQKPVWSRDGIHFWVETRNGEPTNELIYGPDNRYHGLAGVQIKRSNTKNLLRGWSSVTPTSWPIGGFSGGVNWTNMIEVLGNYYVWAKDFHVSAANPDYPFIARSTDNGVTFTEVGSNNLAKEFVLVDLHWIPEDSRWLAFGHLEDEVSVDVFEYRPRVYESTDLLTFTLLADLAPTPSTDSWTVNTVTVSGLNMLVGMTNTVGTVARLAYSTDGGDTWTQVSGWPSTSPALGIVSSTFDGTNWLVGGRDWVGRSTNLSSWAYETDIFGQDETIAPMKSYNGRTVMGLNGPALFRSAYTDDGQNFEFTSNLPEENKATLISYDDSNDLFDAKTVQERFEFGGGGTGGTATGYAQTLEYLWDIKTQRSGFPTGALPDYYHTHRVRGRGHVVDVTVLTDGSTDVPWRFSLYDAYTGEQMYDGVNAIRKNFGGVLEDVYQEYVGAPYFYAVGSLDGIPSEASVYKVQMSSLDYVETYQDLSFTSFYGAVKIGEHLYVSARDSSGWIIKLNADTLVEVDRFEFAPSSPTYLPGLLLTNTDDELWAINVAGPNGGAFRVNTTTGAVISDFVFAAGNVQDAEIVWNDDDDEWELWAASLSTGGIDPQLRCYRLVNGANTRTFTGLAFGDNGIGFQFKTALTRDGDFISWGMRDEVRVYALVPDPREGQAAIVGTTIFIEVDRADYDATYPGYFTHAEVREMDALETVATGDTVEETGAYVPVYEDATGKTRKILLSRLKAGAPVGQGASAARVYKNASQAIADTTLTALTWPVEAFDTDSYHSTSVNTSRFTAALAGKYEVSASVRWDSNTTGAREVYVVANGVTGTRIAGSVQAAAANLVQTVTAVVDLAASEYVEIYVRQDSGGSRDVTSLEQITCAAIVRVGVTAAPTILRGATWVRSSGDIALPVNDVHIRCPVKGVITGVDVSTIGGPGSCVIDVWKDTDANYPPVVGDSICASAKPTISAASKYSDTTLTGWTTAVAAGDWLVFHLESTSGFQAIFFQLRIQETQ